ncbi:MAG TPA: translational GTPase TypA [Thermoanaerobaculia bacterium]|nr:translational GTPase TypA [Thermoanaerobaculia bacterium]HUM29766.1 translational GTPase TypA [Thermoanaerobaculia bacterium]HXK67066.1 translational GTPase TypA [Thermoanaerobaculia bacterium]
MKQIRNIAIIAHVDHGKTTLVDAMLRQTGVFKAHQLLTDRVMDSNDLEREKGITIFSKNASVIYEGYKINIVDTPGHADFGGEVQRIMKMVDSVLLLVDAFEGPMPQTKYVLKKSLELGLKPIVVINKIDRPNCRPYDVLNMVFDLFVELNASEEQLDFPTIYTSAKAGTATLDLDVATHDLKPLFDAIIKYGEEPSGDPLKPFQMLVSAIEYDSYLGRLGTGKIHHGTVQQGMTMVRIARNGRQNQFKVTQIFSFEGLKRNELREARAGDIVSIAGQGDIDVGETITDPEFPEALPGITIDEPTIAMTFSANNSPFMGQEGKWVTSNYLWERLERERQSNVSLVITRGVTSDSFIVKGRGELQLAILIENMRREGYEFQVSKPKVIFKEISGKKMEPIERAIVDVADEYIGPVIEKMGIRKGKLIKMDQGIAGYTRLEFSVPSRGLLGYRSEFLTDTRGTGILNQYFEGYDDYKGDLPTRSRGVLIQMEQGVSVAYGLDNLQDRGVFFIGPGVQVYEGMIVGENNKDQDLPLNVCRTKKLTNMRASGSDDAVKLTPPRQFSIEQALEYIADDELIEITPKNIRLRKMILNANDRKRAMKAS